MDILSFNNVSLTYHSKEGETEALRNLSFTVAEGDFVGIVGPSGCGKTTILSLISGLLTPSSGRVKIDGEEASKSKGKTAYMLQRDQLFDWRNVIKNVTLGLEVQSSLNKDTYDYAVKLLNQYGLGEFLKKRPRELSGGMRQRVALIRTLVTSPKILLLDEAFSSLDYQTRLNVCDDVYSIIKDQKKTAILITHDISEAISMCDQVIVLSARPAFVKANYRINFPKGFSPLERREAPGFAKYFEKIWKDLSDEKTTQSVNRT